MGAGDSGADEGEQHPDHQVTRSFRSLGVCEELAKACTTLGWKEPTRIQEEAIPLALEGRDIIALAQTGSGKTAAFALPILQALLDKPQPFFACALSPTRELAIQIGKHFEALGSSIGVIGGVDVMSEAIALARRPHILVGTPGRLAYHLSNTKGFSLRTLQYLVLDEADRLLDMDFEKEIDEILKCIPKERKTFLFSATMTKKVAKLQRACLKSPAKVEVSSKYCTVETLRQEYIFVPSAQKDCCLAFLLHELAGNTTMVFTRECKATRRLSLVLRYLGLGVIPISGQMSQAKRLGSLNKFRSGECGVLICTDVASRGLDIPNVDLVVNYNVPEYPKDYVHRVGRTARAGKSGRAITIVTQYDIESFLRIENAIGIKLSAFKAESDEMVVFQSSVSDAQRIAIKHMNEKDDGSKRQHGRRERDDEGIMTKYTAKKKKKHV